MAAEIFFLRRIALITCAFSFFELHNTTRNNCLEKNEIGEFCITADFHFCSFLNEEWMLTTAKTNTYVNQLGSEITIKNQLVDNLFYKYPNIFLMDSSMLFG